MTTVKPQISKFLAEKCYQKGFQVLQRPALLMSVCYKRGRSSVHVGELNVYVCIANSLIVLIF
jgi:hypothetical protein